MDECGPALRKPPKRHLRGRLVPSPGRVGMPSGDMRDLYEGVKIGTRAIIGRLIEFALAHS